MSSTAQVRRVRHGVRDGLAVMAFSATASTAVAMLMLLLAHVLGSALGGR
ncbi:MAG: hypothetical protein ACTHJH_01490 [Marmoricola sp.]